MRFVALKISPIDLSLVGRKRPTTIESKKNYLGIGKFGHEIERFSSLLSGQRFTEYVRPSASARIGKDPVSKNEVINFSEKIDVCSGNSGYRCQDVYLRCDKSGEERRRIKLFHATGA